MARTKGASNKRTRAALHAIQIGELGGGSISPIDYLLKVMRDSDKPDDLRIEAAKAVAPYVAPKLSAVEVTNEQPAKTREELVAQLKSYVERDSKVRKFYANILGVKPN